MNFLIPNQVLIKYPLVLDSTKQTEKLTKNSSVFKIDNNLFQFLLF